MERDDAPSDVTVWSARLYRTLLLAFPAPFRRAYGDEMAHAFRDLCRAAGGRVAPAACSRSGQERCVICCWLRAPNTWEG